MASIPNEFPISLQAWPTKNNDSDTSLRSLIERINLQRGSFREISEESLRQEIAEEEAGKNAEDDDGTSEDDDDEEEHPDRLKELMKARDELIGQIEYVRVMVTECLGTDIIADRLINPPCTLWISSRCSSQVVILPWQASRYHQSFATQLD